jgi:dTDP-4-dehydrorhamnose reductase
MRIVVIGGGGQLGHDLLKTFGREDVVSLTHEDVEISDYWSTFKTVKHFLPEIIINLAAYNKVDLAEEEVEFAFKTNAFGVRNLALIAKELNVPLIHLSTDYVFDGKKQEPYEEDDPPNPLNVYGASKLAGEYLLRSTLSHYTIIRTSGLYGIAGSRAKGGNFVETMIRLACEGKEIKVVNDQVLSPTYTVDLCEKIKEIVAKGGCFGLLHITNQGSCSWFEFAHHIFKFMGLEANLIPIPSSEFKAKAKRPKYSVLKNKKLQEMGIEKLRDWKEALKAYLEERRIRCKM